VRIVACDNAHVETLGKDACVHISHLYTQYVIHTHRIGSLTWLDAISPTPEEVRGLAHAHLIDLHVAEDLLQPSARDRVECYANHLYLVLHFPDLSRTTDHAREQEIDFIVTPTTLITVRYDAIESVHTYQRTLQAQHMLKKVGFDQNAGFLFISLIRHLYKTIDDENRTVHESLNSIEMSIFKGLEKHMVKELSDAGRDLLSLRRSVEPHRELWRDFADCSSELFGDKLKSVTEVLVNDYFRVHNHIMRNTEFLHELRETNNSLLTTKQMEVTKFFTILAFITFPLSLVATILGLHTEGNPVVYTSHGFVLIIGILCVLALTMFLWVKRKGWL
jgi:magnesium transporter